jgi:hypothetical protein
VSDDAFPPSAWPPPPPDAPDAPAHGGVAPTPAERDLEQVDERSTAVPGDAAPVSVPPDRPADLDVIEADLADVEVALERLDSGDYWRDESTGEPLGDAVLEARPTARRNPA